MNNESTADELRGVVGGIGEGIKGLGDKFREQEAQKAAGTHDWVKQPDGTSKWLPKDPAAGRQRVPMSGTQPATPAPAPAPAPRMASTRGGQAPAASEGQKRNVRPILGRKV